MFGSVGLDIRHPAIENDFPRAGHHEGQYGARSDVFRHVFVVAAS